MEIKDIIRKKREELNLTYEQLGDMVGVGKSTVRKWETGMIENMRRDNIVALAKALNISPSVIMGWDIVEENNCSIEKAKVLSKKEESLLSNYNKLNDIGKNEAEKRVEELTYINKYIHNDEMRAAVAEEKAEYLIPVAAHADNLTEDEKTEMDRRIEKYMKNRK